VSWSPHVFGDRGVADVSWSPRVLGDRVPFRGCVGRCVLADVSRVSGNRGVADVSWSARVFGDRGAVCLATEVCPSGGASADVFW